MKARARRTSSHLPRADAWGNCPRWGDSPASVPHARVKRVATASLRLGRRQPRSAL